ncbi:glutathione S-transferase T3-like [Manihot esculenta]|uniref:glutathione S-transferase T3-like n=1 Tax=Manihot esculenta TaxID=3983 RepID=UPI000B5D1638|nr:glutathione S-transferase T3-like [Manihot esculenta]
MTSRSAGYSTNEDVLLCGVYLDVSQDPIVGKQQSSQRFWSRVAEAYELAKNECWESRNPRSLQCRLQVIEKAIRKLNGCYRQVENLHPSGASEQDLLNQAKTLLMQDPSYKRGFKFDHVWNMMKDAEKFKDCIPNDALGASASVVQQPGDRKHWKFWRSGHSFHQPVHRRGASG